MKAHTDKAQKESLEELQRRKKEQEEFCEERLRMQDETLNSKF